MAFVLSSNTLESFRTDRHIKLPRFQRKHTWDHKKNFKLCISLYKDFPLGTVVIRKEGTQKWLLDGRQRWTALKEMENPETIWDWGRSIIGYNTRTTESELRALFKTEIRRYLDTDSIDDNKKIKTYVIKRLKENATNDTITEELIEEMEHLGYEDPDVLINYIVNIKNELIENGELEVEEVDEDNNNNNNNNVTQLETEELDNQQNVELVLSGSINELLEIILMVHPKKKYKSEFTAYFDFSDLIPRLPFVKQKEKSQGSYINSTQLIRWIKGKQEQYHVNVPSQEEFYQWLTAERDPSEYNESNVKRKIEDNWDKIESIFDILEKLDSKISLTNIAILELSSINETDSQKIFQIINTEGVQLTHAEVLSAKPSWTKPINDPSEEKIRNKDNLYDEIGVDKPNDVVRWDVAATLLDRVKAEMIIGEW